MEKKTHHTALLWLLPFLCISISVIAQPVANFNASVTTGCSPLKVQFNDLSTGGATSWSWDFGNGQTSNLQNPSVIYTTPGTYTVSLTASNNAGSNTVVRSNYIVVDISPQALFNAIPPRGCFPVNVLFKDSSIAGSGTITSWSWNFGDGATSTLQSPVHTYTTGGTYTVSLTVQNSIGCKDTIVADTIIHTGVKPDASFTYPVLYTCAADPVQFKNQTQGVVTSWFWDFGDGDTSTKKSPGHYFEDTGFLKIMLVATDNGCSDTFETKNLYVKPPIVKIRAKYVCDSPYVRNFEAKYLGPTSYYWDFGDGSPTSTDAFPRHVYAKPGTYQTKLYSFGPECNYTDSTTITIIDENPTFTFNPNDPVICKYDTVKFTAGNYDPTLLTAFGWHYGDGDTSNGLSTLNTSAHVYKSFGDYKASLITQDILGCYDTITNTVTVHGPTVGFNNNALVCSGIPVVFTDETTTYPSDSIDKWSWDFGDGTINTYNSPPFTHTYKTNDTFNVSLRVIDSKGCSDTLSKISAVIAFTTPKADFAISDATNCFSTPVSFTDRSSDTLVTRIWYFGDGNTSEYVAPQYTYSATGNFVVTLIISNQAGCSDTATKNLEVLPLPPVNAGLDSIICFGQSLTLTPTGANTYRWGNDASLSCTDCKNPVAKPQTSTTYYVSGADTAGCSATDSVFVEVKQPITLALKSLDTACLGDAVQLSAAGAEIYNWQPSTGLSDPNIQNPVITPATTGTFVYTVTGTDTKSCFTDTASTTIMVEPHPDFNIIDTNVTVAAGSTYVIKTTSSPDVISWSWSPPTDLSCTNCPEPVAKGNKIIQYTGIATNAYGCTTADQIIVKGLCNSQVIFIPNTFSPNGDHINDYFYPRGAGLYLIKSMRIFNRLGQLVFEKTNFAPDVETEGWNGTWHSNKLPSDVYVYFIEIMCNNGHVEQFKGDITLLR